jgi:hypothetical protein
VEDKYGGPFMKPNIVIKNIGRNILVPFRVTEEGLVEYIPEIVVGNEYILWYGEGVTASDGPVQCNGHKVEVVHRVSELGDVWHDKNTYVVRCSCGKGGDKGLWWGIAPVCLVPEE